MPPDYVAFSTCTHVLPRLTVDLDPFTLGSHVLSGYFKWENAISNISWTLQKISEKPKKKYEIYSNLIEYVVF